MQCLTAVVDKVGSNAIVPKIRIKIKIIIKIILIIILADVVDTLGDVDDKIIVRISVILSLGVIDVVV